ncbi:hypothetical protein JHW45_15810 [Paracoccus stylophorae]|uniref:Uncharacterized protein n=1 Tax=Paracoccus stylophorae TaxID=659350 RepID=A0ABY7STX7_9RHOB|nr:hypothetical protein [Paracoccus stylophorae]WCR10501.1 hypothetical protein JHW45_15810 [Paracoccus stylophorae]
MDVFKDRLAQRGCVSAQPALAHQCCGREIEPAEAALTAALPAHALADINASLKAACAEHGHGA